MKKEKQGNSLYRIMLLASFRQKSMFVLFLVVFLCISAVYLLQQFTWKQETALEDTIDNSVISCTVADSKGMNMDHLEMSSLYVDRLTGKYRDQGCFLDDYVKNVRACASFIPEEPGNSTLYRVYSLNSLPFYSVLGGNIVKFEEGFSQEDLRGRERSCLVSEGMLNSSALTEEENGIRYLTLTMEHMNSVKLRVVGTLQGITDSVICCPFDMPWDDGVTVSFRVMNCSFEIKDNRKLAEAKEALGEYFAAPQRTASTSGSTGEYSLLIGDETYQESLNGIERTLAILRVVMPFLSLLCVGVGFLAGYLCIKSRIREFAVMRCLGLSRRSIFFLILKEQAFPTVVGGIFGLLLGFVIELPGHWQSILFPVLFLLLFLTGAGISVYWACSRNVMILMKE